MIISISQPFWENSPLCKLPSCDIPLHADCWEDTEEWFFQDCGEKPCHEQHPMQISKPVQCRLPHQFPHVKVYKVIPMPYTGWWPQDLVVSYSIQQLAVHLDVRKSWKKDNSFVQPEHKENLERWIINYGFTGWLPS